MHNHGHPPFILVNITLQLGESDYTRFPTINKDSTKIYNDL